MKKKYYIDIGIKNNGSTLQSKLFDSEKQAMRWFAESFSYADFDQLEFCIMVVDYEKYEDYTITEILKEITEIDFENFVKEMQKWQTKKKYLNL